MAWRVYTRGIISQDRCSGCDMLQLLYQESILSLHSQIMQIITFVVYIAALVVICMTNKINYKKAHLSVIPLIYICHALLYYVHNLLNRIGIISVPNPGELYSNWSVILRLHSGITFFLVFLNIYLSERERQRINREIENQITGNKNEQ